MSQYTLGKNWKGATPQEQKEFIRLFSDRLEDARSQGLIDLEHDETRGNFKVRLRKD